jgi:5-methylcytosine-specific restriction endonuclease McrA
MAPVRKAPCLKCTRNLPPAGRGLCAGCLKEYRAEHDTARIGKRERGHYDAAWQKLRNAEVARHMAIHGLTATCGHTVTTPRDLTLDHVKARSLEQGTRVVCRSCNASKGNR